MIKKLTTDNVYRLEEDTVLEVIDDHCNPKKSISFALFLWTPEAAQVMLDLRNSQNRRINKAQVMKIARSMENEEFYLTNQGIAVGADGEMVDGQTRLQSIVDSGCSQVLLTALSVPRVAFSSIDQGRRKHLGDALKHFLGDGLEVGIRTKIRGVVNNFLDQVDGIHSSSLSLPHRVNTYLYFRESFDWVMQELYENNPKIPKLANTSYLAAFVRAHAAGADPESLKRFYDNFINNYGIVTRSKLVSRVRDSRLSQRTAPSSGSHRKEAMNEMEHVIYAFLDDEDRLCEREKMSKVAKSNPTFDITIPEEIFNGEFDVSQHRHIRGT